MSEVLVKPPHVLSEMATVECAINGMSLARFGDGELRLATGRGDAVSQRTRDPKLVYELRAILKNKTSGLLVCIPDFYGKGPNQKNWQKYARPEFLAMMTNTRYGNAFITRPDNAPWINRPSYWARVHDLWADRDVILVTGNEKSITLPMLKLAKSVELIMGPAVEAYAEIDNIEAQVIEKNGQKKATVLLCLGATATCLAWRLARRNIHAVDLGHIGMFMRRLKVQDGTTV